MRKRLILMALAAAAPQVAQAQTQPQAQPAPPARPAAAAPAPDKSPTTVGEVVVTAGPLPVQTRIDRRSYSVSGDLQAQTGSVADALRNIPSVEVDLQGNVTLRGDPNVTILIDGKPSTLLQGDDKGQALQQMPATRIERVEVMTNPSAEFGANGSGGVINLITAKAKGAGATGSLRLSMGSGKRVNGGTTAGLNKGPLSLSGDLNLRHDNQKPVSTEDRLRPDVNLGGFGDTRQAQVTDLKFDSLSGRGSLDYDVDPTTRVGAEAHTNYVSFGLGGLSHFRVTGGVGSLEEVFDRRLDIRQSRVNGEASAYLGRRFAGDGHQLILNLSYDGTKDDRVRSGRTSTAFPALPDSFDQQRLGYDLRQVDFKGDYVRPLGAGTTLKAGFDLQYNDNNYDNRGFVGAAATVLTPDAALTNLFVYRQRLNQAYVTYERPFGALTVLAGLRLEDLRLDLDQVTRGRVDHNGYFHAYPSLHLAWKVSETDVLTASYSHRVQRPQPEEFNSFRFLIDPVNYRAGNPQLKPQETHSFELGYERHAPSGLYLGTLYFRENDNVVSDVVRDLGGGIFLSTRENVSATRNGGLELIANGRLSKSLTYNLSGNVFWSEFDAQPLAMTTQRSLVTGFGRANLNWQATPADYVQFNAIFSGNRLTAQGYAVQAGGLNLGWRHKLTGQVNLLVTAQDVLRTFHERQVIDTPVLKSNLLRGADSRLVFVGFVWTFGGGRPRDPAFDFNGGTPPPQ